MMKSIVHIIVIILIVGGGVLFVPGDFDTRENELEQWQAEKEFLMAQNVKLQKVLNTNKAAVSRTKSRFMRGEGVVAAEGKFGGQSRAGGRIAKIQKEQAKQVSKTPGQVGNKSQQAKVRIAENESRIQAIDAELAERDTKKAKSYDQVLRVKSLLQGLLGMEQEVEAEKESVADEQAIKLDLETAAQSVLAQEEAQKIFSKIGQQLKSLKAEGNQLSAQKKETEKALKTLNTKAEMLKMKVNMGEVSLGATRFERVQKEYKLCTGSIKGLEQKLAKQSSLLEKLLLEYKALQEKWAEQKGLLESTPAQ